MQASGYLLFEACPVRVCGRPVYIIHSTLWTWHKVNERVVRAKDCRLCLWLWEQGLASGNGSCESARKVELRFDTLNTVGRVDVLDESDLVAGCGTLSGDDGRVREEVLPDLSHVSLDLILTSMINLL